MLYGAVEQSPSAELVEPDVLTRYFAKFDEQFFHYCDKELAKINTFYSGRKHFLCIIFLILFKKNSNSLIIVIINTKL